MNGFPRVSDQFGRYRIDGQIGQGGMGVVFAATDLSFDRRVALKVVSANLGGSEEFQLRFEREAALLARLNSPHIIDIFDYGVQEECPYISTQYVGGGDLGGLIQARGPMPPQLAASVCAQIADGLSDAHRAGVVHRDVKPSNVLLRDANTLDLHAYLCDFGIARSDTDGLTQPGSVTGTWAYLAPECGKGETGTTLSDLYALGCLFWVCLTGSAPYRGTDVEVAIAHQRSAIPQLTGEDTFTGQVNQILERSMAKNPRDRYASADEMRADLLAASGMHASGIQPVFQPPPRLAVQAGGSGTTGNSNSGIRLDSIGSGSGPTVLSSNRRKKRRTPLIVGGAVAALLLVGGGIAAALTLGGDDDKDPDKRSPAPAASDGRITTDIDNDGFGDVIFSMETQLADGTVQIDDNIWLTDGEALTERTTTQDPELNAQDDYFRRLPLGDFDGDGENDRVRVGGTIGEDTMTASGELSGGETVAQTFPRDPDADNTVMYVGDADGDGDDDLFQLDWATSESYAITLLRSNGDATFEDGILLLTLPLSAEATYPRLEFGDVTGDGLADMALLTVEPDIEEGGELYPAELALYAGTGDSLEKEETVQPIRSGGSPLLVRADVDGDGDQELLFSREDDRKLRTLNMYDYDDGLTDPVNAYALLNPTGVDATAPSVGVSDIDGDGRDDLINLYATSFANRSSQIFVSFATDDGYANATQWATFKQKAPRDSYPSLSGQTSP